MKKIPFFITEAFTTKPFQGNPAAVFLDCKDINDDEMFAIAKELNIECAFLKEISKEENTLSIRYLSPDVEITFSGHATIASISTYVETNPEVYKNNSATFTVKTKAGSIIVDVEKTSDGLTEVKLHTRIPKFNSVVQPQEIASALNISKRTIETSKGLPMIVNCGADVLIVPLSNIIDIKSIQPDYDEIKKLSKKYNNYGPVVFHQNENDPNKISCRFFFPIIGPDEDIVSGISISAISCYMIKHNFVKCSPIIEIISEQGFMFNRKSIAKCIVSLNENIIEDVLITGNNLTMFECNYIKRD